MNPLRTAIAAAFLAGTSLATAAHAAVPAITYDFTGFTVSLSAAGFGVSDQFNDTWTLDNATYAVDPVTGSVGDAAYTPSLNLGRGGLTATQKGLGEVEALYGDAPSSLQSAITWTVSAKQGWQLQEVRGTYMAQGYYYENGGGTTPVTASSSAVATGGAEPDSLGNQPAQVSRIVDYAEDTYAEGIWRVDGSTRINGNGPWNQYRFSYDADGNLTGMELNYSLPEGVTPLTSVTGATSWNAAAAMLDNAKTWGSSFLDHNRTSFMLEATAVQSAVSPVPEPASYAMMTLGMGMVGFMLRRRQKNGSSAA